VTFSLLEVEVIVCVRTVVVVESLVVVSVFVIGKAIDLMAIPMTNMITATPTIAVD